LDPDVRSVDGHHNDARCSKRGIKKHATEFDDGTTRIKVAE
jgi:hypothetical protein